MAPDGSGTVHDFHPDMVETHASILFFVADSTYKVHKPIDLDFVDNTSVSARKQVSHREVELNSRLAPDVYFGVLDVLGPDGHPVDHVVHMHRLPGERRLSTLVAAAVAAPDSRLHDPVDLTTAVASVADQVAELHAASPRTSEIDSAGEHRVVIDLWRESLDDLAGGDAAEQMRSTIADLDGLARGYLAGCRSLMESRIGDGRIVDGHGDLMADDIYCLDDHPRIIDCLEFSDRFRHGDGLSDIAFLAMTLDRLGARHLAEHLLRRYRSTARDDAPASLTHYYMAYRALVRSKVAAIRAEQLDDDPGAKSDSEREAVALAEWAVDSLRRGRVRLVLVGGVSGSGKSVLSQSLGPLLAAHVLRSDVVRKEGAAPDADLYRPEAVAGTYAELLRRAGELMSGGHSVVLDATWLDPRRRADAEALATDRHAELVEVECTAPEEVLLERVERRQRAAADPSDATTDVLRGQLDDREPWPDAIIVDTHAIDTRDGDTVRRSVLEETGLGPLPWG